MCIRDRTYFAYTEQEKAKVLQEIGQERYTIQRSKGLGENEPDMMSLTTMNPATRRLIKVCLLYTSSTVDRTNSVERGHIFAPIRDSNDG